MQIRQATTNDLPTLAQLERTHLNAELSSNTSDMLGQGFNQNDLASFINDGWIIIAEVNNNIVGYVICADWKVFLRWPIYHAILRHLKFNSPEYNQNNTCQYGPIWIDENFRGQGIFELLVQKVKQLSQQRYQTMLTFIAEDNQHSYFAHTKKVRMQVLDFFEFEDRGYYLLTL